MSAKTSRDSSTTATSVATSKRLSSATSGTTASTSQTTVATPTRATPPRLLAFSQSTRTSPRTQLCKGEETLSAPTRTARARRPSASPNKRKTGLIWFMFVSLVHITGGRKPWMLLQMSTWMILIVIEEMEIQVKNKRNYIWLTIFWTNQKLQV